jgi:hypothetical protein
LPELAETVNPRLLHTYAEDRRWALRNCELPRLGRGPSSMCKGHRIRKESMVGCGAKIYASLANGPYVSTIQRNLLERSLYRVWAPANPRLRAPHPARGDNEQLLQPGTCLCFVAAGRIAEVGEREPGGPFRKSPYFCGGDGDSPGEKTVDRTCRGVLGTQTRIICIMPAATSIIDRCWCYGGVCALCTARGSLQSRAEGLPDLQGFARHRSYDQGGC